MILRYIDLNVWNFKAYGYSKADGPCDPGYFSCPNCCDVNYDCNCDQTCKTSTAQNGICSIPKNIYGKLIFPSRN